MAPRASRLIRIQYPRPVSDAYLKGIQQSSDAKDEEPLKPLEETEVDPTELSGVDFETSVPQVSSQDADTPDTPMRFVEKKRLYWNGKTCEWFHSVGRLG